MTPNDSQLPHRPRRGGAHPASRTALALCLGLGLAAGCAGEQAPEPGTTDVSREATDASNREATVPQPETAAGDATAAPEATTPDAAAPDPKPGPIAAETDPTPSGASADPAASHPQTGSHPQTVSLPPAVQAALDEGRALRTADREHEAIDLLKRAEKAQGESAHLRIEMAWCYFQLAEKAFAEGAEGFRVKSFLADADLRRKQARSLADGAALPSEPVLHAKLMRYSENPTGAKELLTAHIEAHPADGLAHKELGDMAFTAQDWYAADTHLTRAAELDPSDGDARLRATIAKQWLGAGLDALVRGYVLAAKLQPDANEPLRLLTRLAPEDRDQQLEWLRRVVEENPKAVWARVWIAFTVGSETQGTRSRAIEVLEEAAAIQPSHAGVLFNLAQVLEKDGQIVPAIERYAAAVESGPIGEMGQAADQIDRLLFLEKDPKAVPTALRDRAYDVAVARNPLVGRYGNNAGFWYRDYGKDYDKSLKYYLASVEAEPREQDYVNDTALIYLFHMKGEEQEKCLPLFERVLEIVEEDGAPPGRGYWDTLENLCRYWFAHEEWARVIEFADKRVQQTAYPSRVAPALRERAKAMLAKKSE